MPESQQHRIAVIGAGSWGTALAILLSGNDVYTTLWGHLPEQMKLLQDQRSNEEFLPGIKFPDTLHPCINLEDAMADIDDVLVVVPSHVFRIVLEQIKPYLSDSARVCWATKGLENGTAKLLDEIARECLGDTIPLGVVSGPTFARELAEGLPTAITIASTDSEFSSYMASIMCNHQFRAYTSTDVIGVEIGGAVKNILAIAAGIADGLGFGANTRAALITRGLHEIMRLGTRLGGHAETFMGLAGMGDLVLTCTDNQSRNRRFGIALSNGMSQQQALDSIGQVVEGIQTAKEINRLANKLGIEMPITTQVYRVLYEDLEPRLAVQELFERELKAESDQ